MSGHSKWSTIKRQKGATDAKRGAVFTKLGNNIAIATREGGGGDPESNFKLRLAIEKARQANMPKENIARSIERGLGKGTEAGLENALYEGFGPGGIAVIVEAITDNKTRTGSELRNLFEKAGGHLGSSGAVAYMFTHLGEIEISKTSGTGGAVSFDEAFEKAAAVGAEDVEENPDSFFLYCEALDLHRVREGLLASGMNVLSAELVYKPNKETLVTVADETKREQVENFLETVGDLDDVQEVFVNI